MLLALLAAVTVTVQPAAPTVGDRITLEFRGPVVLDASAGHEVVSRHGGRVVIRTFTPEPIVLSGVAEGVRFRNLRIPVRSVLQQGDDMKPAPLAPPRHAPMPREPLIAIAATAVLAAGVWIAVLRSGQLKQAVHSVALPPDEVFRRAVLFLRAPGSPESTRWAALATATRVYLASTRPQLGSDLTTSELLPRLGDEQPLVAEILHQGDLEKFSAEGARPRDFDALAGEALALIPEPAPPLEQTG